MLVAQLARAPAESPRVGSPEVSAPEVAGSSPAKCRYTTYADRLNFSISHAPCSTRNDATTEETAVALASVTRTAARLGIVKARRFDGSGRWS